MRGKLSQRNQNVFNNLLKVLRIEKKICSVRTQGAGKSYLTAAFADEYEKQGKNVLILTSNDRILDKSIKPKMTAKNVTYATYPETLSKYFVIPKVDLIIVDEFHRLGGKAWRRGYEAILQANPGAEVLGLSAEHIRGNGEDMAMELFNGKVYETISMEDAFLKGYYNFNVHYIKTYYELNEAYQGAVKKLLTSNKLDPKYIPAWKSYEKLRTEWSLVSGTPEVIGNYATAALKDFFTPAKGRQKITIFVESLDKVENMDAILTGWFTNPAVGFKKVHIHKLSSRRTKKENRQAISNFMTQRSSNDELDILISVNMANEGLHFPKLNAVLFLRGTRSHLLFNQQIGRVFDMNKTDDVIVFDFVGNWETAKGYGNISGKGKQQKSPFMTLQKKEEELVKTTGGIYKPKLKIRRYGQQVVNFIDIVRNLSNRDYEAEAVKMCDQGNFCDFSHAKDPGFYMWVRNNRNTNPHAKMIWNNRPIVKNLSNRDYKAEAVEMCNRGNFNDFSRTKDPGFYWWVRDHRNTDPHAGIIWDNRPNKE